MAALGCVGVVAVGALSLADSAAGQEAQAWGEPPRAERLRGATRPSREVVLAAPVAGLLRSIEVEEGQRVERGELLAQMDDDLQQASVTMAGLRAQQRGRLHEAQFVLEEAKRELDHLRELRERGAVTEWELDRARLRRAQAEAAVEAEEEAIELAGAELAAERLRLERFGIRAPFDGLVVRHLAEPGSALDSHEPVLHMVAIDPLKAELHLPVELYGRLQPGRQYRLEAEAPVNRTVIATLKTIEPLVDVGSRTFRCTFEIDNPDHQWPAGFRVQLAWPPMAQGQP